MDRPKRLIAFDKKVEELSEMDKKVRILGIVISSTPDLAIVDDGTGTIAVRTADPLEEGSRYRIIGQIFRIAENKYELNAEIVQDMGKLNIDLYQKVEGIKRKLEPTN